MSLIRMVTVVGARPQFVKAAALSREVRRGAEDSNGPMVEEIIVHTGQHYDHELSGQFFADLGLPDPDAYLGCGSATHGVQTGQMMERLEPYLATVKPDLVLVYGDTNSTLAAALVAAKRNTPIAHVEAGLRSFDMSMPEEVNRRLTDHVSTLLLCPSERAVANLELEGIHRGVYVTGDVMLDALRWAMPSESEVSEVTLRFGLRTGEFALATLHRAENTDDPVRLNSIMAGLGDVAADGLEVVLPIHPRTAAALGSDPVPAGVRLIKPVGHRDLLALASAAAVGLTDSGGLQKELYWLARPCVTLRDRTEWTETVDVGWNQLVGADRSAIVAAVRSSVGLDAPRPQLYGAGDSAKIILEVIGQWWVTTQAKGPAS